MLEWLVLIICKERAMSRSRNPLSRSHPILFFIKKRRSADAQYLLTLWLQLTVQNLTTSFLTVTFSTYDFCGFCIRNTGEKSLVKTTTLLVFLLSLIAEAVVRRCSVEKVFIEISQNSQENICDNFSFLIKLQVWGLQLY